jgi:uncharacterized protein involved in response to NO
MDIGFGRWLGLTGAVIFVGGWVIAVIEIVARIETGQPLTEWLHLPVAVMVIVAGAVDAVAGIFVVGFAHMQQAANLGTDKQQDQIPDSQPERQP